MAHPYQSQADASHKRRLSALGAKAGKAWGHSAMQTTSKYPKTHAGTERPKTISGGTAGISASGKVARKRADRYARGGKVKGSSTTNVIIMDRGGGPAQPSPVPVPVPVGGAPPPPAPLARGAPPMPPIPAGRPVMKDGGLVRKMANGGVAQKYHNWGTGYNKGGAVKKAAGGVAKLQPTEEPPPGKTYKGYPHSPTSDVDDAVSPTKRGGVVKKKARGGAVKHGDEAEDRKLFGKMMKERGKKFGGMAGSGTGYSRMRRNKAAAKIPAKTEV